MYDKLPLDFVGVTDGFGPRGSGFHYGTDFGWHDYKGENIYASHDAEVVLNAYGTNLGNYIVTKYENNDNTIINRYLHLKDKALFSKGEKVKRGDVLGYMGETGDAAGVHLHFEYWICPKNYTYNYADRSKYAKDVLKYCYLFNDQEVSSKSFDKVKRVVTNPVDKNKNVSQIEVINKGLNAREGYGLDSKVLGYADIGFYNFTEKINKDDYMWYKIDNNIWIAGVFEDTKLHEVENMKNKFIAKKSGYYYIHLNEGDSVYYEKKD